MNDVTHAAFSAYLRDLADLLGLRDWEIVLMRDRSTRDAYAQVSINANKDEAVVYLSEQWATYSPEQQRHSLTHELLHAHTGRLCRVVTRLAGLAPEHLEYVQAAHDEEEEIVVQRLARVLAPYLPLPPESVE